MKINVMLVLVAFTFFGFLGLIISEHLFQLKMAEQGLQECVIKNETSIATVWQKECD